MTERDVTRDLRELMSSIKVEFVKSFTVKEFIKSIEKKRNYLKQKKKYNLIPNFTSKLVSYTTELKSHFDNILYEFRLNFKTKSWR